MTLLWNRAAGALALVLGASCAGMTSNEGDAGMSDGGADAAPVTIDGGPDGAVDRDGRRPDELPDASVIDGPTGSFIVVRALGEGVAFDAEVYASASGRLSIVPTAATGCVIAPFGGRLSHGHDDRPQSRLVDRPSGRLDDAPIERRECRLDRAGDAIIARRRRARRSARRPRVSLPRQPGVGDPALRSRLDHHRGRLERPPGRRDRVLDATGAGHAGRSAHDARNPITAGSPAELAWTGGEGAQVFHIYAAGDDAAADCYAASDATSFVLTGDVTAALGAHAYGQVSAQSFHVVDIGGSQVLVINQSDNLD